MSLTKSGLCRRLMGRCRLRMTEVIWRAGLGTARAFAMTEKKSSLTVSGAGEVPGDLIRDEDGLVSRSRHCPKTSSSTRSAKTPMMVKRMPLTADGPVDRRRPAELPKSSRGKGSRRMTAALAWPAAS